ncbi:hypothetical protein GGR50DRAFT_644984 [Xylaria sp. CBS 124048]|nr:hypothetical protein GGR50DRAFT_644984 [Xylaria sp. CBS 124048]
MAVKTPRIAIVGAGPGGLMLASILHNNKIPCTVYERDSSATSREQGGTLDIHEYSGQQALDAAGLMDAFRAAVRDGAEAMKIVKKDGTCIFDDNDGREKEMKEKPKEQPQAEASKFVKGRPEVDRRVLKDIMIASLPVETIRWGSKVTSLIQLPDSKQWIIELEDGTKPAPFDLVVGADGGRSRVRPMITDQEPLYSGMIALDSWMYHVDEVSPEVSALIGRGTCFCWDEGRGLTFQRNGVGSESSARCFASVRTEGPTPPSARAILGLEDNGDEVDWTDPRMRELYIERHYGDWDPYLKKMFLSITGSPELRPMYMLPVGITWETRAGITLLGDAAHLMTPYAGVGVNTAMMDALELAQGIVECVKTGSTDVNSVLEMLGRYEKGMFARSSKEAAKTNAAMHLQFSHDGPERMRAIHTRTGNPGEIVFA